MSYPNEPFYVLTVTDIGQATIRAFGRVWLTSNFIGCVLRGDVGKLVFQRGDILQVENDAQRARRVRRVLRGMTGHAQDGGVYREGPLETYGADEADGAMCRAMANALRGGSQ